MLTETERIPVFIAVALLVGSFMLLLAASLSVPVARASKILTLRAVVDGEIRSVDFGIWGYCLKSIESESGGVVVSPWCTRWMVGWTIQSDVIEFLQATENPLSVPSKIETSMLVIYPAVATLAFLCFIWFLSVHLRNGIGARKSFQAIRDPPFSILQFTLACFTALATFFVFLVHVELVSSVKKSFRLRPPYTLQLAWGNSTWFCVVAFACLLGELFIVRNIRNARRKRKEQRLPTMASTEKNLQTQAESHAIAPMGTRPCNNGQAAVFRQTPV